MCCMVVDNKEISFYVNSFATLLTNYKVIQSLSIVTADVIIYLIYIQQDRVKLVHGY